MELHDERVTIELKAPPGALPPRRRLGGQRPASASPASGARHGEQLDQTGRRVRLGADRRYTGPDCPPDMLDVGGIPQGDYAPVPWLLASRGYALWLETGGDGVELDLAPTGSRSPRARPPGRSGCTCSPTRPRPRACAASCALTGSLPALLPEWAYGHWKSRDVYEHQRDVEDDFDGYRRARAAARRDRDRLALGDAVQHLGVQPAPVPRRDGDGAAHPRATACARWSGSRRG